MIPESTNQKEIRAVWSLISLARFFASKDKKSQEMVRFLDQISYLPELILDREDREKDFIEALAHLSNEYEECKFIYAEFLKWDPQASAHKQAILRKVIDLIQFNRMLPQDLLKQVRTLIGGITHKAKEEAEDVVELFQLDNNMHSVKIENYERDHGLGTFVHFRQITAQETEFFRIHLKKILSLPEEISSKDLVNVVSKRSFLIQGFNAEDTEFDLYKMFAQLNLVFPEKIYLNWYHFEELDEIFAVDLVNKFNDIWYPSSDDLDLLDPQAQWVISIHHTGAITLLRPIN